MKKKICVVTDSTSDLPIEITKRDDVFIIPLTITFQDKDYKDGKDISTEQLLEILKMGKGLPKTSQPNPKYFFDLFNKLIAENYTIISIHISSKISGTFQCALLTKDMINSDNIYVIDSKSVSLGLSLLVIQAIKMIDENKEVNEIVEKLEYLSTKIRLAFAVDDLKYLRDGGRLSSTKAAFGTLLNIKPIIHMDEGFLILYGKPRGMKKSIQALFEYFERFNINTNLPMAIGNVECSEYMDEINALIDAKYPLKSLYKSNVGSVVAVYCGPGTLGIAFFME